jgi:hypothetical protein
MEKMHLRKIRLLAVLLLVAGIVCTLVAIAFMQYRNKPMYAAINGDTRYVNVSGEVTSAINVVINARDLVSNGTNSNLNVAELRFRFDPQIVALTSITPGEGLLSLAKNINNTTGTAAIDLAQPGGNFAADAVLIQLQFTFLVPAQTTLTLTPETTLGAPNSLDVAKSKLSFTLTPPIATSSSTTTASSNSASSSRTRSKPGGKNR